jgi:two-component system sensor histidine kinase KdpD
MSDTNITPEIIDTMSNASHSFNRERERIHRQMLSSVSHDLKTPLASIIGSLEVYERMKDKLSQDKQFALIRVALQEAYRLDNFITNILDMAKLENGAVKPRWENTDIGTMLRNCLIRMSNRLQNTNVEIKSPSGPIEALTDPILLSRVICLVLDNAVKFGGIPPVIEVEFGRDEADMGFIQIHDNGRGIPEAQAETIFSKYTRFAKEDQQNAGTGLGLAICREIMQILNGGICANVYPQNGGALVTLRFSLH